MSRDHKMPEALEAKNISIMLLWEYASISPIGLYDAAIQTIFQRKQKPTWRWVMSTPYSKPGGKDALHARIFVAGALDRELNPRLSNDYYYKLGIRFAQENPKAVEPRRIEIYTASGQKTVYCFEHPQAAAITVRNLEKLPLSYFA